MNFRIWFEKDYAGDFENDPSHVFGKGTNTHTPRQANPQSTIAYTPSLSTNSVNFSKLLQDLEAVKSRLNDVENKLKATQKNPGNNNTYNQG